MLVGDSSVGKTCLLTKFRDGQFLSGSFICTVGIDFRVSFIICCLLMEQHGLKYFFHLVLSTADC